MKRYSIIILLFTIQSFGQITDYWNIQFTVVQDVKLATMDDDYGNVPFTLDIYAKTKLKSKDKNYYSTFNYEFADLNWSYNRASFGMGLYKEFDRLELSADVNTGFIIRGNEIFYPSFGSDFEVSYGMFTVLAQVVQRSEINKVRASVFGGINIKL